MKIYTRGGDKGQTSLFTGGRVDKVDTRIEALGSVDELVAVLGIAKAAVGIANAAGAPEPARQRIEALQAELYLAMADIAGNPGAAGRLAAAAIERLEQAIDTLDAELPPLTDFLIPGASPASAALHHARTVCRRAERRVLAAARENEQPANVAIYLNRLSDLLFVLARWVDRDEPDGGKTFKETL